MSKARYRLLILREITFGLASQLLEQSLEPPTPPPPSLRAFPEPPNPETLKHNHVLCENWPQSFDGY